MTRLDKAEVLAHARATVPGIIRALGLKGKECAGQWRTTICPVQGSHHRDACAISMESGMWHCHVCSKGGDVADLVAGCSGLDVEREFPAVLERVAELSGYVPTSDPREAERVRADLARREAERQARDEIDRRERDQRARAISAEDWTQCTARHPAGEAYAATRGIDELIGHDVFRFDDCGRIATPLHAADGAIVNVVRRNHPGAEPKVFGKRDCPILGTFGHSLADITGGCDVAIVEGLSDSITARILWPDAVILGAHGACNIPKLAPYVAKRVARARARLYLVPHLDGTGLRAVLSAGRAAQQSGLTIGVSLFIVDLIVDPATDAKQAQGSERCVARGLAQVPYQLALRVRGVAMSDERAPPTLAENASTLAAEAEHEPGSWRGDRGGEVHAEITRGTQPQPARAYGVPFLDFMRSARSKKGAR